MDGGYDAGYRACPCFWGTEPASFVKKLEETVGSFHRLNVFDAGCGEGKNAVFLAERGAQVLAIDISEIAIEHAQRLWQTNMPIIWRVEDIRSSDLGRDQFDIVIAYGLLHCLQGESEVARVLAKIQRATRRGGYNVIAVLNGRLRDLQAHPELKPCWLAHSWYVGAYEEWDLVAIVDSDLREIHPHNKIWHTHAITRILARKV